MFLYGNSASYVGGWKKNVPHGQGKFKNTDGFVISGDFQDGIPSVWPTNIQIQNKSPIKVYKGEHITVDVQYVDKDGNPVNCYQGFTVSISCWFQKPKVPSCLRRQRRSMVSTLERGRLIRKSMP